MSTNVKYRTKLATASLDQIQRYRKNTPAMRHAIGKSVLENEITAEEGQALGGYKTIRSVYNCVEGYKRKVATSVIH
jgi:hypothetical protein